MVLPNPLNILILSGIWECKTQRIRTLFVKRHGLTLRPCRTCPRYLHGCSHSLAQLKVCPPHQSR